LKASDVKNVVLKEFSSWSSSSSDSSSSEDEFSSGLRGEIAALNAAIVTLVNQLGAQQATLGAQQAAINALLAAQPHTGITNAWQAFTEQGTGVLSVRVHVDLTPLGLTTVPKVYTSLGGNDYHWRTTGATSIYALTKTGFDVYVKMSGNADQSSYTPQTYFKDVTVAAAKNTYGWFLQYVVFPQ
jgi:hypothetical protein